MLRYRRMSADRATKDVEISSAATENQKVDNPINYAEGAQYDTMKQKPNRTPISTSSFQNDDNLVNLKSQSASVSNYMDPVIPITLIHGVPDRIYFFSYNLGINKYDFTPRNPNTRYPFFHLKFLFNRENASFNRVPI